MRKVNTRCQKNTDEILRKSKPSGLNQAGRPEIFRKITKPPSLDQNRPSLNLCRRATEDGHRLRPAGLY